MQNISHANTRYAIVGWLLSSGAPVGEKCLGLNVQSLVAIPSCNPYSSSQFSTRATMEVLYLILAMIFLTDGWAFLIYLVQNSATSFRFGISFR